MHVGKFFIDLQKFNVETLEDANIVRRKVVLEVSTRVIMRTPVDTGHARGGWQTTVGNPPSSDNDRIDKGGSAAISEAVNAVSSSKISDTVFLSNLVPYIVALEEGDYPDPPKKGTYIPKRRGGPAWEIRSVGGFSKQAPRGMLAVSLSEFPYIVTEEARGTKFG